MQIDKQETCIKIRAPEQVWPAKNKYREIFVCKKQVRTKASAHSDSQSVTSVIKKGKKKKSPHARQTSARASVNVEKS